MRVDAHTDDWPRATTNWCWSCRCYFEVPQPRPRLPEGDDR